MSKLINLIWKIDVFLHFFSQLTVRRKNAKEMFGGFFKNMVKSADEVLISGIKVSTSLSFSQSLSNDTKLTVTSCLRVFFDTGSR